MSLSEVISKRLDENPDAESLELARAILDDNDRDVLITALVEEIEKVRRNRVRGVERTAFAQFFKSAQPIDNPPEVLTELRRVFSERFSLGGGIDVLWGKATIEQHRLRIAMLTRLRSGIDQTIERHVEAIRLIEAHNATCLDEIELAA